MTFQVDPLASLLYKEWHRNESMTIEWQIKYIPLPWTTEWWWNDGMRTGWLWLKLSSQNKTVKIEASYWSRAQNRGLSLVERTQGKKSKALTLFRNSLSFFPHLIIPMREWHWNDRMTWEWYKLIEQICRHTLEGGPLLSIEWYHNERMTLEW